MLRSDGTSMIGDLRLMNVKSPIIHVPI